MSQRARRNKRSKTVVLEMPPLDLQEARRQKKLTTSGNKNRSLSFAYDETEGLGLGSDMRRSGPGMLSEQERKEVLYKAYLNNVWISSCVDVIAKRITSGGYTLAEVKQGAGIESEKNQMDTLFHYVNDDEDFLQLIRSIATDLGIYGESFMEIVSSGGKPAQLHKVDCQTMSYELDKHGAVVRYVQRMEHTQEEVTFQPDEIIRWWFPDPKASKKALSPIERILGPVDADAHMADWVRSFFRRGTRPNLWIKFLGPKNEAERFVAYLRENYTGAASAHVPLVTYDGAEVNEIGKGSIDMDFGKGREAMCKEILAGYQVPPAIVGLIESGNIGGGTGESQEKSFQYNACDPVRQLIFEKFNYRVVQKGFGITTWTVNTRYADYRSDDVVTKIQDTRIRNGSNTINEVRREMGKEEIEGGDEAVVVASRDIIPVQRLADMADEQRQTAQVQLEQQATSLDAAKTRNEQMKANPQAMQQPGTPPQKGQQPPQAKPPTPQKAKESNTEHSGVMVAFMLDYGTGMRIAIPDGERPDDMHVTLAYLPAEVNPGRLSPTESMESLKMACAAFAATTPPLQGTLNGIGRFLPSESSDGMSPIVALVNAPGLQVQRQRLVDILSAAGYEVAANFDYSPHVTLAYIPEDAPTPIHTLPQEDLWFWKISIVVGNEQYDFPLGGNQESADKDPEPLLDYNPQHDAWEPADTDKQLAEMEARGVKRLKWKSLKQHKGSCDKCIPNEGQVVELGQPFNSGARLAPQHPNCLCVTEEVME